LIARAYRYLPIAYETVFFYSARYPPIMQLYRPDPKRMSEEQVAMGAWHSNSPGAPSALPAMAGAITSRGGNDSALQSAITQHEQSAGAQRARPPWSEKNTGLQAAQLKERALPAKELQPGEQIMGLVFFNPYEAKDKVELSIPVGETTFVIPFSGPKAKK